MAGKPISIRALRGAHQAQVPPRLGVRIVAVAVIAQVLLAALLMLFPARAGAQGVKGEIAVNTQNGYARLVFTLTDEVEADVKLSNGILIIAFKRPVEVSADRIVMQAGNYVSAARVDPDFTAVRMALNRKVTVNTMAAGEKLFVDLLPENWTGLPPGLPQEVVDELARRAREAEKRERARKQIAAQRNLPPVRVRVGTQPTFTRYTFELPALIPVSIDRTDGMTLTFESPLRFDLADAQAALPPMVAAVEAKSQPENALVHFDFVGKVDVRTFREDNNYIVDVQPLRGAADAKKDQLSEVAAAAARMAEKKPPTKSAPAAAPEHAAPPEQAPAQAAAPEHAAAEPTPPAPALAQAAPKERHKQRPRRRPSRRCRCRAPRRRLRRCAVRRYPFPFRAPQCRRRLRSPRRRKPSHLQRHLRRHRKRRSPNPRCLKAHPRQPRPRSRRKLHRFKPRPPPPSRHAPKRRVPRCLPQSHRRRPNPDRRPNPRRLPKLKRRPKLNHRPSLNRPPRRSRR